MENSRNYFLAGLAGFAIVLAGCSSEADSGGGDSSGMGTAPSAQESTNGEQGGANATLAAPTCEPSAPTGETAPVISETVGDVTVTTAGELNLRLEDAVRVSVNVTNNGANDVTVADRGIEPGWAKEPQDPNRRWFTQLLTISPGSYQVAPGDSVEFAWHLDPEGDLDERGESPQVTVKLDVAGTNVNLPIPVTSQQVFGSKEELGIAYDSPIVGTVVDEAGNPVAGADVQALLFSLKERLERTQTDEQGQFALCVPSTETYVAAVGNRPSGYDLATHLSVNSRDGGFGFATVRPRAGEQKTVNVVLHSAAPQSLTEAYAERSEVEHGWFWIEALNDGYAFTEGRHPPELRKPGQVGFTNGQSSWLVDTGDECWGFDVSATGSIAVGCHDGTVTVLDSSGKEIWQRTSQKAKAMYNRAATFSPDGSRLLTGPLDAPAELVDASNGSTLWKYTPSPQDGTPKPEILRTVSFAPDGTTVSLGFAGGWLAHVDVESGKTLWEGAFLGEFPLSQGVDETGTTYAVGKGRELAAIDNSGEELWRAPLYEAVSTTAINPVTDTLVFGHTVNGTIWAVEKATGELAWMRKLGAGDTFQEFTESSGHNALAVDASRGLLAHVETIDTRDGGGSVLSILNFNGVVLATTRLNDERETVGPVDHQIRGGQAVAFGANGDVAVAMGDGFIRVFTLGD